MYITSLFLFLSWYRSHYVAQDSLRLRIDPSPGGLLNGAAGLDGGCLFLLSIMCINQRNGLVQVHDIMWCSGLVLALSVATLRNTYLDLADGAYQKLWLTVFKLQPKKFRFQSRAPGQRTGHCPSGYCFMTDSEKDFKHEDRSSYSRPWVLGLEIYASFS